MAAWLAQRSGYNDAPLYFRADEGAPYAHRYAIDLGKLGPLVAKPFSPDNVKPVEELAGMELQGYKNAVPEYREALFAIPRLGTVSPPTRTPWGWDIILWYDVWPPVDQSDEFFTRVRELYFGVWAQGLARAAGVKTEVDEALLAELAGGS